MDVKVYTTPTCGYCHQVKRFLAERGVKYTEYDVSADRAAANEMVSLTGQMGVPVITVDGQVVVGFDRPQLERLLSGGNGGQHAKFGLKIADAGRIAQTSGAVPIFGAFVGAVAPSSLGERAGIRKGDVIIEVNQRQVNSAGELEHALSGLMPGSKAALVFLRGQEKLKSDIVI